MTMYPANVRVELPDGRTYVVQFDERGDVLRVTRTNCGPGMGGSRKVPFHSPLRDVVADLARAQLDRS
jgi:hypothetical protein